MKKTCIVFSLILSLGMFFSAQAQKRSDGAKKGDKLIDVNIDAASVDLTGVREV